MLELQSAGGHQPITIQFLIQNDKQLKSKRYAIIAKTALKYEQ